MVVQLKDKLQKRMEGSKGVDPFTVLPPEIIRMIFDYFSFKHMVQVFLILLISSMVTDIHPPKQRYSACLSEMGSLP